MKVLNSFLSNYLHGFGGVLEVLLVDLFDIGVCLRLVEIILGSLEVHLSCEVEILGGLERGQDQHVRK